MEVLTGHLRATILSDKASRQRAEAQLQTMQATPGFVKALVDVASNVALEEPTRLAAAAYFKNLVKDHYNRNIEHSVLSEDERTAIKTHLVDVMCAVPPLVQAQFSNALAIVSQEDFPDRWPGLLEQLISKLGSSDMEVVNGVLETANAIFKRFRNAHDNDALRRVLKGCLTIFQEPLTQVFQAFGQSLTTTTDAAAASQLVRALRTTCRIFYSLNWLDLPGYFEDHMKIWMSGFEILLQYENPALSKPADTETPGVVEHLKTAIMHNVSLYAEKYEEEFGEYYSVFVGRAWHMLTSIPSDVKYDNLVVTTLQFLTNVVSHESYKALFQDPSTLRSIVEQVVVPSIMLRKTDVELFEDNPTDYIRMDIEGTDQDTRRRAATNLLQGMCKLFETQVTALAQESVARLLALDAADPRSNWTSKEGAITLAVAVAVKGSTREHGATVFNPAIDIGALFGQQITPELSAANINDRAVVKATCIKFVCTLRSLLQDPSAMMGLFGSVGRFLEADNEVLYTYAAAAIERMLSVRVENSTARGAAARVLQPQHVGPLAQGLCTKLFSLIMPPDDDVRENEYLMQCLCRVVESAGAQAMPVMPQLLDGLVAVLQKIAANPNQPLFYHHAFETLALMIRTACKEAPASAAHFETTLFPPFQEWMAADNLEFMPYVFQELALLLELRPAEDGVSAAYMSLLHPILQAELWDRKSLVPALMPLIKAFLHKGAAQLVAGNMVVSILGIFQKLINQRATESEGAEILWCIFCNIPAESMAPLMTEIFKILILRQQKNNTAKFVRLVVELISVVAVKFGAAAVEGAIDGVRRGLFAQMVDGLYTPNVSRVLGPVERRTMFMGALTLLCSSPAMLNAGPAWAKLLGALVGVLESPDFDVASSKEAEEAESSGPAEHSGTVEFTGTYSRLVYATLPKQDPVGVTGDYRQLLVTRLNELAAAAGQSFTAAMANVDPKVLPTLDRYRSGGK